MAKNTSTSEPHEAGDSNARAVRRPPSSTGSTAVPQTPQRDAKDRARDSEVADESLASGEVVDADDAVPRTAKAGSTKKPAAAKKAATKKRR